jgi:hypothetical protein
MQLWFLKEQSEKHARKHIKIGHYLKVTLVYKGLNCARSPCGIEGKYPFFVTDNSEPIRQNTVDYSQPTRIPETVS